METTPLFITATRKKYRFESSKGGLTLEDLWDLDYPALDRIAIALDEKITKAGTKSFVNKRAASAVEETNKLEIVKIVIATKQEDDAKAKDRVARAGERQFLKGLQEKKRMDQLEQLSAEEIEQRLAAIGDDTEE